ncbi:pimeloyl-[acyl-carrier protein] methyl ester esterase [Azotobacter beijerinckii]|uniref:Pimeloyl-[acyl-carrier protein] methyl ester esterase n=1 Tax=Azotobacter beijerinckii TaxID=170623 RepID=A0A1H9DPR4_9GAMM|nr:alpha/beta fold hydrolase [Azotobacter beijerinckii]SEQ15506.1 pimeloyl-[acyl-carrier protein] methyl ester esterase [Azotobacter beijerinckii]
MSRLILLPGWGLGPAALEPLAGALAEQGLAVERADLPALESANPDAWLAELDERLPDDAWLGGWSLGGMLAAALAARRGARCRGLLTLASNACFVAREDWPSAMSAETFAVFRDGCAQDASALLKRFALLCSQGCGEARALSRQLNQGIPAQEAAQRLAGLAVLAALDNRAALAAFAGPQLHLLAEADALVPTAAAEPLRALLERGAVERVAGTGHAFVLEQPQALAARLATFVREADDD